MEGRSIIDVILENKDKIKYFGENKMTTSKVYVLMEIEQEMLVNGSLALMGGVDKYELKNINVIGVYTDRKIAEEDLKKYEENACDNIIYCLQVSCLFKK